MNKITPIDRSRSVVTGKPNLKHLITFTDFPVFFGCVDTPREEDMVMDMVWEIDPETGMIQLSKLVPLEILYQAQHIDPLGKTWDDYNEAFSSFVANHSLGEYITEIGSGNGLIAKKILDKCPNINLTAVEPNPSFEETKRLSIIKEFFPPKEMPLNNNQTVIFSQLFEHVYDPQKFLLDIAKSLPMGGRMIFAYPQLEYWFQEKYTNAINFEHTMLMTDYFVDLFLWRAGFSIYRKKEYKQHSHFYVVVKTSNPSPEIEITDAMCPFYEKMFHNFIQHHLYMVEKLNIYIDQSDDPVFLFGGHIFSQFLIKFGLKTDKIVYILDNSTNKQEKRLYGTDLTVKSPEILRGYDFPKVILKAGLYNDEIKEAITKINPNTVFI